jgi:hypothetical protein
MNKINNQDSIRRHISDTLCNRETQRLYEDHQFVLARGINVVIYLIAWSPYSFVALAQIFVDQFSIYNPWLMTICALLAKLYMMINPIIYTFIRKGRELNTEQLFRKLISNIKNTLACSRRNKELVRTFDEVSY